MSSDQPGARSPTTRPRALDIGKYTDGLAVFLERRWAWFLALFSLIYWVGLAPHAANGRYFWYDELYNYYVANLEDWATIMGALTAGADFHPPLSYLLGHTGMRVLGDDHLGLRLPSLVGFWGMCLAIFFFVRRRCGALFAAAAMLLPFAAFTRYFAVEARGYALWLGFSALAMLSWQAAAENRLRALSLTALAASLFGAIGSHWYGVLSFAPMLAGEGVRAWKQKRLDWPMLLAIAAGASALVAFFQQMMSARDSASGFPGGVSASHLLMVYVELCGEAATPLLASLGLLALAMIFVPSFWEPAEKARPAIPIWEWAAVLTLCALPIVGAALSLVTHTYRPRYVAPAVVGLAIFMGVFASQWRTRRNIIGAALFFSLFTWFLVYQRFFFLTGINEGRIRAPVGLFMNLDVFGDSDEPIAIAGHQQFLPLTYYWPAGLRGRAYYIWDDRQKRHPLKELAPWGQLNVVSYSEFLARRASFWVYGQGGAYDRWLFERLAKDGVRLEVAGTENGELVFKAQSRP